MASFTNITTQTTTLVKSGAGHLKRIILAKTAAGTIEVRDGLDASGTLIATLKASIVEGVYDFEVDFKTGLCIVTGAASDLTVVTGRI